LPLVSSPDLLSRRVLSVISWISKPNTSAMIRFITGPASDTITIPRFSLG